MGQKTIVLRLSATEGADLRRRLDGGDFEFRDVPHAKFSVRGEGVTATLYTSGKLVVQGAEPELFTARHLGEASPASTSGSDEGSGDPLKRLEAGALVGSDEAGKGDFLGPLVVAAVRIDAGDAAKLRVGGIGDSKRLSDERVLVLGPALRERFAHAVVTLDPPEYNDAHASIGNLNLLLARLHGQAIRQVARPDVPILVDRFAAESVMKKELRDLESPLHQAPRAERIMAVAAASIVAREAFLNAMRELSDRFGLDVAKGAGPPADRAARRFVGLHGRTRLGEVAKLHFKNTSRVDGGG